MSNEAIPTIRPGHLAASVLRPHEKRWFLTVLRVLEGDGMSTNDAYELISKAFYVSDRYPQASIRDILNALHETSRALGYAVWKDDNVVKAMAAAIEFGLSPDVALNRSKEWMAAPDKSWEDAKGIQVQLERYRKRFEQLKGQLEGSTGRDLDESPGDPIEMALKLRVRIYQAQGLSNDEAWKAYVKSQGYEGREYNLSKHLKETFYRLFLEGDTSS